MSSSPYLLDDGVIGRGSIVLDTVKQLQGLLGPGRDTIVCLVVGEDASVCITVETGEFHGVRREIDGIRTGLQAHRLRAEAWQDGGIQSPRA